MNILEESPVTNSWHYRARRRSLPLLLHHRLRHQRHLLSPPGLPRAQPLPLLLQRAQLPAAQLQGDGRHQHHHRQAGHDVRRVGPQPARQDPLPADRLLLLHDDPRDGVLPGQEDDVQPGVGPGSGQAGVWRGEQCER